MSDGKRTPERGGKRADRGAADDTVARAARARSLRAQIEFLRRGEDPGRGSPGAPGSRSPREELQELEQRDRRHGLAVGKAPVGRPAPPGARPRGPRAKG